MISSKLNEHLTDGVAVDDIYQPDKVKEAINVFGADDVAHPAVAYLHHKVQDFYVGQQGWAEKRWRGQRRERASCC